MEGRRTEVLHRDPIQLGILFKEDLCDAIDQSGMIGMGSVLDQRACLAPRLGDHDNAWAAEGSALRPHEYEVDRLVQRSVLPEADQAASLHEGRGKGRQGVALWIGERSHPSEEGRAGGFFGERLIQIQDLQPVLA